MIDSLWDEIESRIPHNLSDLEEFTLGTAKRIRNTIVDSRAELAKDNSSLLADMALDRREFGNLRAENEKLKEAAMSVYLSLVFAEDHRTSEIGLGLALATMIRDDLPRLRSALALPVVTEEGARHD